MKRTIDLLLVEPAGREAGAAREALEAAGTPLRLHRVSGTDEAIAFLEKAHRHKSTPFPSLIVIEAPGGGAGLESIEAFKRDPSFRRLPIVVVVSSATEADVARAYELRAASVIRLDGDRRRLAEAVKSFTHYWGEIVRLPPRPPA